MSAQAPEAVAEASIEDRIAATFQPAQEQEAEPVEQPVAEQQEQPAAEEVPAQEAQDESLLNDEQLKTYKVKVKIDGEEKEVSLDEARLGYMRFEDYNRKTRDISTEKTKIPDIVKAEVEKARTEYQSNVKLFEQAYFKLAGEEMNNIDWNKLANDDPAEFVKKSHRAQQIQNALKAAKQEVERMEADRKAEVEKATAQALEQSVERLKVAIPNWGDELSQKITKSAIDNYGLSKEELSGIVDDRYVRILHDAMQFRALKDTKLIDKKVTDLPKVLKPGTQQSKALVNAEKDQELRDRLRKSGHVDDLAAILQARQSRRK